jgi:hypothetical protein
MPTCASYLTYEFHFVLIQLMSLAQNWADTNAMQDECRAFPSGNHQVGENLYAKADDLNDGNEPVVDWYNEMNNYDWDNPGTGSGDIGVYESAILFLIFICNYYI